MQITRYNEINVDSNAIHLTNNIGAIGLVGVGFSHPSGTLQINDFAQFTHFTATFEGTTYVYKVNGFNAINSGVCEVTYSLDYLKDYFYKHTVAQLQGLQPLVLRSTSMASWNKYAYDDKVLLTGDYSISYTEHDCGRTGSYIIVMKGSSDGEPPKCFCCNASAYENLLKAAQADYTYLGSDGEIHENIEALDAMIFAINNIAAVYYAPYYSQVGTTQLTFYYPEYDEKSPVTFPGVLGSYIENRGYRTSFDVASISIPDFRKLYYDKYMLYVPYFGCVPIPVTEVMNTSTGTMTITYYLRYNFIDGTMSLAFSNKMVGAVATVSMPKVAMPSPNKASSYFNEALNYNNSIANMSTGVLGGAVSGAMTGSFVPALGTATGAVLGAASGLITNMITASNSHNMNMQKIQSTSELFNGSSAGFMGWQGNVAALQIIHIEVTPMFTTYGAIVNEYMNEISVENAKYWLDVTNCGFGGPDWYVAGVKDTINNSYILIN